MSYGDLFGNSIKMAKEVVSNCAAHYPERADKVFVINAPGFFSAIWTVSKRDVFFADDKSWFLLL